MKYLIIFVIIFLVIFQLKAADKYWVGGAGAAWSGSSWSLTSGGAITTFISSADRAIFDVNASPLMTHNTQVGGIWITNNAIVSCSNGTTTTNFTISGSGIIFTVDANASFTWGCHSTVSSGLNLLGNAEIFGSLIFNGSNSSIKPKIDLNAPSLLTIKSNGLLVQGINSSNFSATISGTLKGLIALESNAVFQTYRSSGCSILDGNYDSNSTVKMLGNYISGTTSFNFNGTPGVSIGNLEYNPISQTIGGINLTPPSGTSVAPYNIKGHFKILNTNGFDLRFCSGSNSFLNINGNLEIASGCKFSLTGGSGVGTVNLKKDLINNGEITESGGATACILNFNGTIPQNISSSGTFTEAISLGISNTLGVTALTDVNLSNNTNAIFTLTSGNIDLKTNNKILFVQNPITTAIVGGTINSHFIGKLKRATNTIATYAFPVCDNTLEFAKCELETTTNAATNFQIEFLRPNPYYILGLNTPIEIVTNYYWDIQRTLGTSDAVVRLFYNGLSPNYVLIPNQLKVAHFNTALAPSPGLWENMGGVQNPGISTTSALTCTLFSPYALGGIVGTLNSNENSLIYFNAKQNKTIVDFNWQLAPLHNYDYIQVLKSNDGINFSLIQSIKSIQFENNYTTTDRNFENEKSFYKLRLVTKSGLVSYSKIITFNGLKNISNFKIQPTITKADLNLFWNAESKSSATINIYSLQGANVYNKKIVSQKGINNNNINLDFLSKGVYLISLKLNNHTETIKFIKD